MTEAKSPAPKPEKPAKPDAVAATAAEIERLDCAEQMAD